MRLINAEALLKNTVNAGNLHPGVPVVTVGTVNLAPTVEAVPVKCGECKFRDTVQCPVANHLRSTDGHTDGYFSPVIIKYCGSGERKDGEK